MADRPARRRRCPDATTPPPTRRELIRDAIVSLAAIAAIGDWIKPLITPWRSRGRDVRIQVSSTHDVRGGVELEMRRWPDEHVRV